MIVLALTAICSAILAVGWVMGFGHGREYERDLIDYERESAACQRPPRSHVRVIEP